MQDFNQFSVIQAEIERGLAREHQAKFDPDGLHQYYVWDEAFGGPSVMDRIRGIVSFFRLKTRRPNTAARKLRAIECLPES